MAFEIQALLEPVSEELPCGEDLYFETEYQMLDRLVAGREESQYAEAEEPDWRKVEEMCVSLFEKGKHLQVAVWLLHAQVELSGWSGLAAGLALVEKLLADYWEQIFPELDDDDDDPALERLNVLRYATGEFGGLRKSVLQQPIAASRRMGNFSWRDVMVARGDLTASDAEARKPQLAEISAAFRDTSAENSDRTIQNLQEAAATARRICDFLKEKLDTEDPADFSELASFLEGVAGNLTLMLEGDSEPVESPNSGAVENETTTMKNSDSPTSTGEICGRADVLRAFDRVCAWYEKNEPSSPVPQLVQRARKMVGMNFREIIEEVANDASSQVQTIFGQTATEEE